MATARTTINTALRKLGVVGAGRDARTSDMADCLVALQGMYTSWIAAGTFGRLRDVIPAGDTYAAYGNERILRENQNTLNVTLPELVSDAWVPDYGRERRGGYYGTTITIETVGNDTVVTVTPSQPIGYATTPRDGSAVVITDTVGGQTNSWLYDGTIKRWQGIELLQLDDEAPRSTADPLGLASCLAMEVADQYNGDITQATALAAARYKTALTTRYGMRREEVYNPEVYV